MTTKMLRKKPTHFEGIGVKKVAAAKVWQSISREETLDFHVSKNYLYFQLC